MATIKARQKATWESGDFGQVAKYNMPSAEEFMARLPLRPGLRVLDVACGTGNLAVIAARAGCLVAGVDLAANLIAQARIRARDERLSIDYQEGDAEDLPYPGGTFDLVVTMYGAMFAPRPDRVATELARVTKPGGLIAMANWTSDGFIGRMFDVFGRHLLGFLRL
jgi:ubiquinone/menaquinone biosynthesis C-methylase UbiE